MLAYGPVLIGGHIAGAEEIPAAITNVVIAILFISFLSLTLSFVLAAARRAADQISEISEGWSCSFELNRLIHTVVLSSFSRWLTL